MLLGAISKRFDTIVEFTAFQDYISFDRKSKNKIKRIENHKIKVTIELDVYDFSTPSELEISNYIVFGSLSVLIKLDMKIISKIEKREIKRN